MDKVLIFIEVLIGAFGQMWIGLLCLIGLVIGIFIAFGLPIILVDCFLEYILQKPDEKYRSLPKITFKSFYDFYSLSPNTWNITENYVSKIAPKEVLKFTFEGKEYRKYMRFYKKYKSNFESEQNKAKQENKCQHDNEQTIKLLKTVQEEINTIKAQSVKEINESVKITMKIQDKIMGG